MRDVARRILVPFGILFVLALAGAVLVQPSWCAGDSDEGASGKSDPRPDKATDKESPQADDEKPGDFWIDLRDKHGDDLNAAINEAIREMHERLEAIENQMDDLMRRSPWLRDFDRDRVPEPWWRDRPRDRRDLQPGPDIEELLRYLERELPREWPLHMQELLRELERDWPRERPEGEQFRLRIEPGPGRLLFTLRMDMQETDEAYILTLDMPGMEKEDIVVEVNDNVLSISGERKERVEEEREGERVQREIVYGRLDRTVTLPRDANVDEITSKYEEGVLTITVPKTQQEAEKGRRIIVHHP